MYAKTGKIYLIKKCKYWLHFAVYLWLWVQSVDETLKSIYYGSGKWTEMASHELTKGENNSIITMNYLS